MTHFLKMLKLETQMKESGNILIPPPPLSPLPSFPSPSSSITSSQSPSSNGNKISPAIILIIIILAIIFFVSGILHLLVRFLMKRASCYSSVSQSNRHPSNSNNTNTNTNSVALQRQLQQLFRLHDSGLDQALIDALPVFYYKDIVGLKEPFDCAVCLCEFSDQDKLRLLPLCSHAFHISCIDTWLLSNSTCPLCRGSLLSSGLENQEFSLDYWRELSFGRSINSDYGNCIINLNNGHSFNQSYKPTIMEENASERRVFSVRLGKFKNLNEANEQTIPERENGETSTSAGATSQLDARRCYSLGSYQYVLAEINLQVALSEETGTSCENAGDMKVEKDGNFSVEGEIEGKKIRRNRGESFSVSKIWLWSKKGKFPGSSETNVSINGGPPPLNVVLPLSTATTTRDHIP